MKKLRVVEGKLLLIRLNKNYKIKKFFFFATVEFFSGAPRFIDYSPLYKIIDLRVEKDRDVSRRFRFYPMLWTQDPWIETQRSDFLKKTVPTDSDRNEHSESRSSHSLLWVPYEARLYPFSTSSPVRILRKHQYPRVPRTYLCVSSANRE